MNKKHFKQEHRTQFRFWLDTVRPEENKLALYITNLKRKRHFAQTIRDALRLIYDLRQGKVDVLLSLFPWIEDYFRTASRPAVAALADPVYAQLDRIEHYFERLPSQLESNAHYPPSDKPMLLTEPPLDGEATIVIKRSENGKSAWNALISAVALTGNFAMLPPEVLEYGVQIGRIPSSALRPSSPIKNSPGGPKPMQVPQFSAPVFDEDDDDFALVKQ